MPSHVDITTSLNLQGEVDVGRPDKGSTGFLKAHDDIS